MSESLSKKPQSERELKTARTLNTVATIGAGHALYSMTPESKRLAVRNGMLRAMPKTARPRTEKALNALKQPELGGKLGTAGKVVAGGWLALHSGELAGDIMARRSINNQLGQMPKNQGKVDSVKKNDMSMISKAGGAVSRNGHGKGISENKSSYVPGTIAATGGGAGAAYYGNKAYKMNRAANQLAYKKPSGVAELLMNSQGVEVAGKSAKRSLKSAAAFGALGAAGAAEMAVARKGKHPRLKDVSKGLPSAIRAGGGGAYGAKRRLAHELGQTSSMLNTKTKQSIKEKKLLESMINSSGQAVTAISGRNVRNSSRAMLSEIPVKKAYRRFDPEADRQRRLGLYAGTGVGGSIVAGREAARNFETKVVSGSGTKAVTQRGLYAKAGKGKKGLGLTAIAAASGALGVGSYKRGLSQRNQPWT